MKDYSVFCLLALVLAGPAPAAAGDLTTAEIRNRLVGQSIRWWDDGWSAGELMLEPDGSARLVLWAPFLQDEGTWRIEAGALCTRWSSARAGQEKCYRLRSQTDRRFLTTGGNVFEVTVPDA
jgi:hypothetical protein